MTHRKQVALLRFIKPGNCLIRITFCPRINLYAASGITLDDSLCDGKLHMVPHRWRLQGKENVIVWENSVSPLDYM